MNRGPVAPAKVPTKGPPWTLAVAAVICGALMSAKVVIVGELFVGEPILILVASLTVLFRGVGRRLRPGFFWMIAAAGLVMLLGYVVADVAAATGPGQYLRGWARTVVFGLDALALMILVSHHERLLWWFALGLGTGLLGNMALDGAAISVTTWKTGYGIAFGILVALASAYASSGVAASLLAAFGVATLLLDYRGLGAVFLLGAAVIAIRPGSNARRRHASLHWLLALLGVVTAVVIVVALLEQSDHDYHRRRIESNTGRYAGILVAAQAIADSPLLGYGSWAADKRYVQMLRREFDKASAGQDIHGDVGDSMLPHSQLLQAWVEGGLAGGAFFVLLAVHLGGGLRWLIAGHRYGRQTAIYTLFVLGGLWNLLFSPFLGQHRIFVACAIATLSLLAWEKAATRSRQATRRPPPAPSGIELLESTLKHPAR
ncbi:MAG TPA: O-antigen ligase family protein [Rhodocyclaceae bacterium]|nr:O-antigen ligase family protein [Rhodocyclaceae bacterium]